MNINGEVIPPGFAAVGVKSSKSLDALAKALEAPFGLIFEEADAGMFDEYPAYVAYSEDMRFALLGAAEGEGDDDCYELLVEPLADKDMDLEIDVSDSLVRLMLAYDIDCSSD